MPDAPHVASGDHAGPADLGQLMVDVGSVPNQIGAVLVLDGSSLDSGGDLAPADPAPADPAPADLAPVDLARVIGDRLSAIRRLRQRLETQPRGGGPAVWVEDPDFDVRHHVEVVACPEPGDEAALLALAARRVTTVLPPTAPRWRVTVVTGLSGERIGVIAVFHHVLADGIGGLAVLTQLVDEGPSPVPARAVVPAVGATTPAGGASAHRPAPGTDRAADGGRGRGRRSGARAVLTELGRRPTSATRCSLNRPTGPDRAVAVVRTDLAAVKAFGRAHGQATVNDVVLGAVAGALGALLRKRGEHVDQLVATVMVAPGATVDGGHLAGVEAGNRAGIAPIALPTGGSLADRLPAISARMRPRTGGQRGATAAPFGTALRLLARLRLLRWVIDHQRMVHTFVTNLRGPSTPVSLAGWAVTDLVPISLATGNVTVAFAVLSYAGTLTITVVTDPTHHPDREVLLRALEAELAFARPGGATGTS